MAPLQYAHLLKTDHPRLPRDIRSVLSGVGPDQSGRWLKSNTDRFNILIAARLGRETLSALEETAISMLAPVFEGRWRDHLVQNDDGGQYGT